MGSFRGNTRMRDELTDCWSIAMRETPNPFTNRGVITDPNDFFGRKEQLDQIIERLQKMQSCSVVGPRRIGKSSLLNYLSKTGACRLEGGHLLVYLDLQRAYFHTSVGWLRTVLCRIGKAPDCIENNNTLNRNLIEFSEVLNSTDRQIVLCLDEFENILKRRKEFTEDFFDHMRSELQTGKLAFVTATQSTLQKLCIEGKLSSPFYNVFTRVKLGELTEAEAEDFIVTQDKKVQFSDSELEFIAAELQLHPLKLQIECDWIIRNRHRRLSEEDLAREITEEFANYLVGMFDPKRLLRMKKAFSIERIKYILETIKAARAALGASPC